MFSGNLEDYAIGTSAGPGGALRWPLFKWAGGGSDAYFARLTRNALKVYQTPDMTQLDKKDVKLEGVMVRARGGQGWEGRGLRVTETVWEYLVAR